MAHCRQLCAKHQGLYIVALANQQMEGVIPSFTSTLSILALQKNRLKVLPDIHLKNSVSGPAIFLHNNLLSCCIPWCGDVSARASIVAIGNRLQHPKGKFPAWVSKYEQYSLLWASGADGMSLVQRINGAVAFLILVVASKLGRNQLLVVSSKWQIGPTTHLWVVKSSSLLVSCMVKDSLLGGGFLDVSSRLGSLCMPTDIGNCKRLPQEQRCHLDGGVLVLV